MNKSKIEGSSKRIIKLFILCDKWLKTVFLQLLQP